MEKLQAVGRNLAVKGYPQSWWVGAPKTALLPEGPSMGRCGEPRFFVMIAGCYGSSHSPGLSREALMHCLCEKYKWMTATTTCMTGQSR